MSITNSNSSSRTKAVVAKVKFGYTEIEGLLLPDGSFGVSVSQTGELFSVPQNNRSRDFKALLGEGFQFLKVASELNPKKVDVLTQLQFETVAFELSLKGNESALTFTRSLVGLSLYQLFCDAFEIEVTAKDRQFWMKVRQQNKESFWFCADEIADYLNKHEASDSCRHWIYPNCMDALNLGLFGLKAAVIKTQLGIGKNSLNRDHYGKDSLIRIEAIQRLAGAYMIQGIYPIDAIKKALAQYSFEITSYLD